LKTEGKQGQKRP
jgi:hypothetical protein